MPLPLALHLAIHTVIGVFCMFAGAMNLIDPTKILPESLRDVVTSGVGFLALCGLSWGYVFGIFMGRREVVGLGFVISGAYVVGAGIVVAGDPWMAAFLAAVGVYGLGVLARYRARIIAS